MKAPTPTALVYEDDHGDTIRVARRGKHGVVHVSVGAGASSCHIDLTPEQARGLAAYLTELAGDGETAETLPEGVAHEAHDLIYGDREDEYGHPRQSFTRIGAFWSVYLSEKLADGEFVSPEDVARMMVLFKVSRDMYAPKRDNRVDGIGYFIGLDRLETGR